MPKTIYSKIVVNTFAIGSLAADSISVREDIFLAIEQLRKMESIALASVDEVMAHNNKDLSKGQPVKNEKIRPILANF